MLRVLALGLFVALAPLASAEIVISEWMYTGAGAGSTGEFVEFTNVGATAVDMTGWSFDDDSRTPGTISLSAFGVVAPGESVILTDETAASFATAWGLSGVKIIGGNTASLGRNDEINLYNAAGTLVDRLTYGDETYPATGRTLNRSCNLPATDYSYTVAQTTWALAMNGDAFGSKLSTRGELGSPGQVVRYAPSDFDQDGDVDVADFDALGCCMTGPGVAYDPLPPGCSLTVRANGFLAADYDEDDDVDLRDFAVFQLCYSGAETFDPNCGRAATEPPPITQITLNGTSITVTGNGVTVNGTKATITSQGTYNVTGTLTDGQLVVNTSDGGGVELVLNGVNISNSHTAPVYVVSAGQATVILPNGSLNYLSDPNTYVFDPNTDEPSAALYSKSDLTIYGSGSLTVHGHYNDAIAGKDSVIIGSGTFNVTSVDDGIRGKDSLLIQHGSFTLVTTGDGLKSDNDVDVGLGNITIQDGTFNITSGGDAITAQTAVSITGGNYTLVSGGGHTVTIPSTLSAKGVKGTGSVTIGGGTFNLDCADDGVHSNGAITISGGTLTMAVNNSTSASYGDGIHADGSIHITGGTITVTAAYEGIEAPAITIDNGTIHVTTTDDGINGAGLASPNNHIYINGGWIYVNAQGDGIDSNGSIAMTAGTVIVNGPTANDNAAIDYDSTFTISGGFLVAAGSKGMAQAPNGGTQRSVKITYTATKAAGTMMHIQTTTGGTNIVTFVPVKQYSSVVVSSPAFTSGLSCQLYTGGSCSGTPVDGLYQSGTYTPGTLTNTFTTSSTVTNVNAP